MLYYEGLSCPVCQQPFKETDDMVVCPICGLPHHRNCWSEIGHCQMTEQHGTEEQWSREQQLAQVQENVEDDEETVSEHFEPGFDTAQNIYEYSPTFTPSAATQRQAESEYIADNLAAEYAAMIGQNAPYYLPRFRRIGNENKNGGWNWAAFIFGWRWLLYRKQYKLGIALFIVRLLLALGSIWIVSLLGQEALTEFTTTEEILSGSVALSNALMENAKLMPLVSLWSSACWLYMFSRVFLGIFGNRLYYLSCQRKILKIKRNIPNVSPAELLSFGGTALGIALIFHLILEFAPSILMNFLIY